MGLVTGAARITGIVHRIYKVEHIDKPLDNYRDIDVFKIYVSDLGLLCSKKGIVADDILFSSPDLDDFKGGLVENYVDFHLTVNGYCDYYWVSERDAEVDFIIQRGQDIISIEVKSADNVRSKSLNQYFR